MNIDRRRNRCENKKRFKTSYIFLSFGVIIGVIILLILILNYGNIFPQYKVNNFYFIPMLKIDASSVAIGFNHNNNTESNSINKPNVRKTALSNELEVILCDICKSYSFREIKQEKNNQLNRTIFYYDDNLIAIEVARKIFLKADSLARTNVEKVRVNCDKSGTDIYFNNGLGHKFIISTRAYNYIEKDKTFIRENKKYISIIIDDVGDNLIYRDFLKLNIALTFSIIPLRKYSLNASHEIALFDRHSIMIHAPFESATNDKKSVVTFYTTDTEKDIYNKLDKFLNKVPFAKGMNNHQGSVATADKDFMEKFMKIFSKTSLYFIDSLTTPHSFAYSTALKYNIKTLKRNVFLDNEDNYDYINHMLNHTIQIAEKTGQAIAIGHVTKINTLKILLTLVTNMDLVNYSNNTEFIKITDLINSM